MTTIRARSAVPQVSPRMQFPGSFNPDAENVSACESVRKRLIGSKWPKMEIFEPKTRVF